MKEIVKALVTASQCFSCRRYLDPLKKKIQACSSGKASVSQKEQDLRRNLCECNKPFKSINN